MKRTLLSAALIVGSLSMVMPPVMVVAQNTRSTAGDKAGTSDIYLQGHLIMLDGDKLKKQGDFVGAFYKYRDARDIFDSVHATAPAWNPEIVEYRRKKIREEMDAARKAEGRRRAAGGEVSGSGVVGAGAVEIEPALPANEPAALPRNTSVVVQERMRALQAQIQRLEKRNEEINQSFGAKENDARKVRAELLDSRNAENEMRARLLDAQAKLETAGAASKRQNAELIETVENLKNSLTEATDKLSAANNRVEEMAGSLTNAYAEIKTLTAQRDELQNERNQMQALLTGDTGPKGLEKVRILTENQRLKTELASAQAKISVLSGEKDASQKEIATLKEQLVTVQQSLGALQAENEDYRQQIAVLTSKLDRTSKRLTDAAEAGNIPQSEAVTENMVLREIILTQLKQQNRRELARKNLMEELGKEGVLEKMKEMGADAEKLLRSVNEMAAAVDLNKEQRNVITSKQINQLVTNRDGSELFLVQDSAADAVSEPTTQPEKTGAADKGGLSTELRAYANAAEEHFRAGSFGEAESNFRKILVVEPQNVYALCNLGVTQLRQSRYDDASQTLKKALAYNYDSDFAHYLLGVSYLRQGEYDDAASELREGLKLNGSNAPAHHTLGLIAIKRGQKSEAAGHFQKALEIDPSCADADFNLAVYYGELGQLNLCRQHYRKARANGAKPDPGLDRISES